MKDQEWLCNMGRNRVDRAPAAIRTVTVLPSLHGSNGCTVRVRPSHKKRTMCCGSIDILDSTETVSIAWLKVRRIGAVEGTTRLSGVGDMSSNLGTVKRATRNSPKNIPNAMMSGAGKRRRDRYMVKGIILVRDEEKEWRNRDQGLRNGDQEMNHDDRY